MKAKDITRFILLILLVLFIALYVGQMSGYYEYTETKKTTLTKDAIERFEQDVKEGKTIKAKDYLPKEKNYNNKMSTLGMKVSSFIEKGFNKTMNALFNEISKSVSDK